MAKYLNVLLLCMVWVAAGVAGNVKWTVKSRLSRPLLQLHSNKWPEPQPAVVGESEAHDDDHHHEEKKFYNVLSRVDDSGHRVLTYYGMMLAGAVARSAAATAVHPLNVVKTMLQCRDSKMPALEWSVLSRGAGAQFLMSIPHGALSFAVTEVSHYFKCCK